MGHPDDWRPVSVFAHVPARFFWQTGLLVGGLNGGTTWNWLYVSHLWIKEAYRGLGVGKDLLTGAEAEGRRRGVAGAHLTTASFQARGFYEKLGYHVFGRLDDMPAGETLYYLYKRF